MMPSEKIKPKGGGVGTVDPGTAQAFKKQPPEVKEVLALVKKMNSGPEKKKADKNTKRKKNSSGTGSGAGSGSGLELPQEGAQLDEGESILLIARAAILYRFLLVWRDSGVSLKGQICRLPEQPC